MHTFRLIGLWAVLLMFSAGPTRVTAGADLQRPAESHISQYTPTYYVGPNNCDDNGDATREQPLCTVQHGLSVLEPGDVLLLLDGVYHERVYVEESGTPDQPIVIVGESHNAILDGGCPDYPCDARVILAGEQVYLPDDDEPLFAGFFVGWVEHVVLDGFTIRNAPTFGIEVQSTTDVTIQNMRVENAIMSVVNVYDSYDFKLLHNELSGGNLGWVTPEGDLVHITFEEAVSIVNTDGFEIAHNYVHDGFKEGINTKVGTRNGSIHHNTVERLCAVGIYLTEVHNVDVFGNTVSEIGFIRNTMSDIGPRSDEVQRCDDVLSGTLMTDSGEEVTLDYEPGDGIMLAVGDLGYGLDTGTLSDVRIYQNVVHDVNVGCLVLWDELRETERMDPGRIEGVTVYNNVFYNCAQSRSGWGPGITLDASVVDIVIANNIIAGASDVLLDAGAANITITHNLIFQAGGAVGDHTLTGDPLFVDSATGDFRVQAGSPAIDAGIDVGLPFAGAAPDLGAFETSP